MNNSVINLSDLLKIADAYRTLDQLAKESNLTNGQYVRYMDTFMGRVVLDRVISSLNATFEVKA
jgi:hypothetical protein